MRGTWCARKAVVDVGRPACRRLIAATGRACTSRGRPSAVRPRAPSRRGSVLRLATALSLADHLAVFDRSAPRAGLLLERLDVRLEAMQVPASRALDVAHAAGGLLERTARLEVERQLKPRQLGRDLVEGDPSRVVDPLADLPLDLLIGTGRDDLGLELLGLAPDLGGE